MESIKKFQDCKIQNMDKVYGGNRNSIKYASGGGHGMDKKVYIDGRLMKTRTHVENWFDRD